MNEKALVQVLMQLKNQIDGIQQDLDKLKKFFRLDDIKVVDKS